MAMPSLAFAETFHKKRKPTCQLLAVGSFESEFFLAQLCPCARSTCDACARCCGPHHHRHLLANSEHKHRYYIGSFDSCCIQVFDCCNRKTWSGAKWQLAKINTCNATHKLFTRDL